MPRNKTKRKAKELKAPKFKDFVRDHNKLKLRTYGTKKSNPLDIIRSPTFLLMAVVILMLTGTYFLSPGITGFFISEQGMIGYEQNVNWNINENITKSFVIEEHPLAFELRTLRLSGSYTGNGTVKAYLVTEDGGRYLILDDKAITKPELTGITGLFVSDADTEPAETEPDYEIEEEVEEEEGEIEELPEEFEESIEQEVVEEIEEIEKDKKEKQPIDEEPVEQEPEQPVIEDPIEEQEINLTEEIEPEETLENETQEIIEPEEDINLTEPEGNVTEPIEWINITTPDENITEAINVTIEPEENITQEINITDEINVTDLNITQSNITNITELNITNITQDINLSDLNITNLTETNITQEINITDINLTQPNVTNITQPNITEANMTQEINITQNKTVVNITPIEVYRNIEITNVKFKHEWKKSWGTITDVVLTIDNQENQSINVKYLLMNIEGYEEPYILKMPSSEVIEAGQEKEITISTHFSYRSKKKRAVWIRIKDEEVKILASTTVVFNPAKA